MMGQSFHVVEQGAFNPALKMLHLVFLRSCHAQGAALLVGGNVQVKQILGSGDGSLW